MLTERQKAHIELATAVRFVAESRMTISSEKEIQEDYRQKFAVLCEQLDRATSTSELFEIATKILNRMDEFTKESVGTLASAYHQAWDEEKYLNILRKTPGNELSEGVAHWRSFAKALNGEQITSRTYDDNKNVEKDSSAGGGCVAWAIIILLAYFVIKGCFL